jgi:lysophospholipase L1-like esterase
LGIPHEFDPFPQEVEGYPVTTVTGVTTLTVTPAGSTLSISYSTAAAPPVPTFAPASTQTTTGGAVTIGTVAPGTAGDTLAVALTHDGAFASGSTLALSGTNVVYTPGTITAGNGGSDTLTFTLTESNGETATFTATVTLSYVAPAGAGNGVVAYNWKPATQLPHFAASLAAGGRTGIACYGDSTTQGVGANPGQSWPSRLAAYIGSLSGVAANYATFTGLDEVSNEIVFAGEASVNWGFEVAGHGTIVLTAAGDTATWTPEAVRMAATFDSLDIYQLDYTGTGFSITLTGVASGTKTYAVANPGGNTGVEKKVTLSIPLDTYSSVKFAFTAGQPSYITGVAFWHSGTKSVQTYNLGVGGSQSSLIDLTTATGTANMLAAAVNRGCALAIIDYCLNDMLFDNVQLAASIANLTTALTTLRANGIDVILVIPHPFGLTPGLTPIYTIGQFIAAMEALATSSGVGVIDLNSTYANDVTDYATLFISSGVHPNAAGYDDMAARMASAITGVSTTYPASAAYVTAHPMTNIPPGRWFDAVAAVARKAADAAPCRHDRAHQPRFGARIPGHGGGGPGGAAAERRSRSPCVVRGAAQRRRPLVLQYLRRSHTGR